ncbi:protein-L-isoaspartate O-methyltransferase family protein [Limibacillus halophilus]|uniref:Protein-L-isoaspartate O-methyltransferase n=1 Tax=Limibacillus halophilus TaxID=1579333 RepID=A0A839SV17_9PROT|nr:protein-L-isoaspartate O-methyltransferase [Limibacillus halophilus]MBB3065530.1 protein-L-isoaspartate(D-aspartate) O-methyltransferase [Limibacillus halophilus]
MIDFEAARHNMVESQIRTNKVRDLRIVDAMDSLPRELFAPENRRGVAYIDEDLPIGNGRYMIEPMVLARLVQAAEIKPGDLVLDLACASGYCAALLTILGATVVAVEPDADLIAMGTEALNEAGIENVVMLKGDPKVGYEKQAPYNVILLPGAVAEVPAALFDQLADGGRLVTVVRTDQNSVGAATLYRRSGKAISSRVLFDASTPLLPGFERQPGFVF